MKFIIGLIITFFLVAALGVVYMWPKLKSSAPENAQTSLIEAQRFLGLLMRAEEATKAAGDQGFPEVAVTKTKGRFQYSENWKSLNYPLLRDSLRFNFRCSAEGVCQAMELKGDAETGNGIGCDVGSGEYQCYGEFIPVTTSGFDGAEIVVGCKAP